MLFSYYFWNNSKKQGFVHGKLIKPLWESIDHKKIKIQDFIKEQTNSVLSNDMESSDKEIKNILDGIEINKDQIALYNSQQEKEKGTIEKRYLEERYLCDSQKSDQENKLQFINKKIDSLQLEKATKKIPNLLSSFDETIGKVQEYITKSTEGIRENRSKTLKNNINLTEKEVKESFSLYNESIKSKKANYQKDLIYGGFLCLIILYDIIFGANMVYETVDFSFAARSFRPILATLAAVLFIAILIGSTHILLKIIKESKTRTEKNMAQLSILLIFLSLIFYVLLSNTKQFGWSISSIFSPEMWSHMLSSENKSMTELIFRLLLIPGLLVGEYIIEKLNRENLNIFFKTRSGWLKRIKKIIAHQLYLLNKNSIINYAKEEQIKFNQILQEMKEESNIYALEEIRKEIVELSTTLVPIYDHQKAKQDDCINQIKGIEDKIMDLTLKYENDKENIETNYKSKIGEEFEKIKGANEKIYRIKQELSKAENNVGEGIRLGLVS